MDVIREIKKQSQQRVKELNNLTRDIARELSALVALLPERRRAKAIDDYLQSIKDQALAEGAPRRRGRPKGVKKARKKAKTAKKAARRGRPPKKAAKKVAKKAAKKAGRKKVARKKAAPKRAAKKVARKAAPVAPKREEITPPTEGTS
jgi:hypothetical protein